MTNTNYFVQCGQIYIRHYLGYPYSAIGKNVWSDSTHNYVAQDFNIGYGENHSMKFALGYLGSGYGWFMSCTDYSSQIYDEFDESYATGLYLIDNKSTSIFLENYNLNSTPPWYTGFPYYLSVSFAARVKNGVLGAWGTESKENYDAWGYQQTQNVITGSLTNYQTASWYLPNVLPGAFY